MLQLERDLRRPDEYPAASISRAVVQPQRLRGWTAIYRFNEQVSSSATGDLNDDGRDELLLAGINGNLKAVDPDGRVLWSFKARGRINEVTVQQAGTKKLVFIATENWFVQALDTHGNELWKHKFPDDAAHREFKGNLIGITNVRIAYPDGKAAEPTVMVGTQFRYVYELDLKGNKKNQFMLYFYGIEDMEFADLDGDGRDEGMFGLEYFYYTLLKDKKQFQGKSGGPGWKVVDVLNNGQKYFSMLLGSKQGEIRMVNFKNHLQEAWIRNAGGEINDISHGDFDQDGEPEILVGSEGFQFYVLDKSGKTVFRKSLNDRVLKVEGVRKNGTASYLAAVANGNLSMLSSKGTLVQSYQFTDEISNILVTGSGTTPFILLANGDLYKME